MATNTDSNRRRLQRLGKYAVTGKLGSGGMSRVYRAVADGTSTEVALKVTPIDNDIDVEVCDYQREVMIGRRVRHPHVVTAFDHGCRDGYIYLVMPIVEGATLSNMTRLRDPSRKPSSRRSSAYRDAWAVPMLDGQWTQIASMGVQLSDALAACHEAGVIHRDLKPANVMMDRHGDVYLTDFGLAWMRRGPAGHELETKDGTNRYLPPEVFEGKRDERSDIYSLGFTLHELATGRKPWGDIDHETVGETRPELRVPPVRSIRGTIPEGLAACIDRACAEDPDQRHQTARELETDFSQVLDELMPPPFAAYEERFVGTNLWQAEVAPLVLTEEVWFS